MSTWKTNVGPWELDKSNWAGDEEPWDFTESADKPRYNEGDEITDSSDLTFDTDFTGVPITETHAPCGYWPKRGVYPGPSKVNANIYGLASYGVDNIYGVYFNGRKLYPIGYYNRNTDDGLSMNGLIANDGHLLTVAGEGATAKFREISTEPNSDGVLYKIKDTAVTDSLDITNATYGHLYRNVADDRFFYIDTSAMTGAGVGKGGRYISYAPDFSRNYRSYLGTSVIGTDGHKYVLSYGYTAWNYNIRPVDSDYWESFYFEVDRDDRGSAIWDGFGEIQYTSGTSECYGSIYDGVFYAGMGASPENYLHRLDINNPTILGRYTKHNHPINAIVGMNEYIYCLSGISSTKMIKYNTDGEDDIKADADLTGSPGDMALTGRGGMVVTTIGYVTNNPHIYLLTNSFGVADSIQLSTATDPIYTKVARIDDRYMALGGNNTIAVLDTLYMVIIDSIDIPVESVGQGWHTSELVVFNY